MTKAKTMSKKMSCVRRGGEWYDKPVPMCISEDRIDIVGGDLLCDCFDIYEGKGKECECHTKDDSFISKLTLEADSIELKKRIDIKKV